MPSVCLPLPDARDTGRAMSQENLDLVRAVHEGWARGDFSVGADRLALDFEWHQFPQAVEPGTRRGEEVGGALRKIFDVYEDVRVEAAEFVDAGDKVVVIGRTRGRPKGAACSWTLLSPWYGHFGTANLPAPSSFRSGAKPSKPPGCGNRRCRRRRERDDGPWSGDEVPPWSHLAPGSEHVGNKAHSLLTKGAHTSQGKDSHEADIACGARVARAGARVERPGVGG